jgi:hypothetical protein
MFIELTQKKDNNEKIFVNLKEISRIENPSGGKHESIIRFSDGKYQFVMESYDMVKELIKHEISAERGY